MCKSDSELVESMGWLGEFRGAYLGEHTPRSLLDRVSRSLVDFDRYRFEKADMLMLSNWLPKVFECAVPQRNGPSEYTVFYPGRALPYRTFESTMGLLQDVYLPWLQDSALQHKVSISVRTFFFRSNRFIFHELRREQFAETIKVVHSAVYPDTEAFVHLRWTDPDTYAASDNKRGGLLLPQMP